MLIGSPPCAILAYRRQAFRGLPGSYLVNLELCTPCIRRRAGLDVGEQSTVDGVDGSLRATADADFGEYIARMRLDCLFLEMQRTIGSTHLTIPPLRIGRKRGFKCGKALCGRTTPCCIFYFLGESNAPKNQLTP